jgi:hypothetical protein
MLPRQVCSVADTASVGIDFTSLGRSIAEALERSGNAGAIFGDPIKLDTPPRRIFGDPS